jgi:hypothetical protein
VGSRLAMCLLMPAQPAIVQTLLGYRLPHRTMGA